MRVEREREKIAKNTKKPKPRSKAKIRSPKRTYRKKTAAAQNKKTTSARKTAARLLARSIQSEEESAEQEDDVPCGVCGVKYGTDNDVWIECSDCSLWFHTSCVDIDEMCIPDVLCALNVMCKILVLIVCNFYGCSITPYNVPKYPN